MTNHRRSAQQKPEKYQHFSAVSRHCYIGRMDKRFEPTIVCRAYRGCELGPVVTFHTSFCLASVSRRVAFAYSSWSLTRLPGV